MRIRYVSQEGIASIVYLEYRVKSFWGYTWKIAARCIGLPNESYTTTLGRLERIRLYNRMERRQLVGRMTELYCRDKELAMRLA